MNGFGFCRTVCSGSEPRNFRFFMILQSASDTKNKGGRFVSSLPSSSWLASYPDSQQAGKPGYKALVGLQATCHYTTLGVLISLPAVPTKHYKKTWNEAMSTVSIVYHQYTPHTSSVYHQYTPHTPSVYQQYTPHTSSVYHQYTPHTSSVYHQYTISILPIHHQYTISILPIHHQYIISILPIHHQYTAHISSVYTHTSGEPNVVLVLQTLQHNGQ